MQIELTNKEEISKVDINHYVSVLNDKIDSGEINPFLLLEKFKALEKIQEGIKLKLITTCVNEASKYPEKILNLFGAEFKIQEVGTKYDYSNCNDPILKDLNESFLKAKKRLEDRQSFLKSVKNSETIVDSNFGEIVTIYPPVKTSSTSISCSIK